jgi:hypothetical protein
MMNAVAEARRRAANRQVGFDEPLQTVRISLWSKARWMRRQSFDGIDRAVDARIDAFRRRADAMLSKASAAESRRILGVHLLADTPIAALPD